VVRDSSVVITNLYELDNPEVEYRCRRDIPHPFRPALRLFQLPILWVSGLSWG